MLQMGIGGWGARLGSQQSALGEAVPETQGTVQRGMQL